MNLIFLITFLVAFAQVFFKLAVEGTYWFYLLGVVCYGVGSLLLFIAMKEYELSRLYPSLGLTYAWVLLLSSFVLGESLTLVKGVSVLGILVGVSLLGGNK